MNALRIKTSSDKERLTVSWEKGKVIFCYIPNEDDGLHYYIEVGAPMAAMLSGFIMGMVEENK